jgi:hypothetical protein
MPVLPRAAARSTQKASIWNESVPMQGGRAFAAQGDPAAPFWTTIPEVPDEYTAAIHGTSDFVMAGSTRLSSEQLAELIRADPAWQNQPVRLISCDIGAGSVPVAQELTRDLGVPVIAPTKLAWTDYTGSVFVDSGQTVINPATGQSITIPANAPGDWEVFSPGQP